MNNMLAFFAAVLLAASASAESPLPKTIEIDGVTYTEVAYISHDPARVKFSHTDGMASIDIAKMPDEIRSALGYDPDLAAKTKAAHAQEAAALKTAIEEKKRAATQQIVEHDKDLRASLKGVDEKRLDEEIRITEAQIEVVKKEIRNQKSWRSPEAKARYERLDELGGRLLALRNERHKRQ